MRKECAAGGSVFADLGFDPEACAHLKARSELMFALRQFVEQSGLSQNKAAKLFGVTQPRVSDLVRGRIDLFSTDALIDMAGRAGAANATDAPPDQVTRSVGAVRG